MTKFDPKSGLWLPERPRFCSLFPVIHGVAGASGGAPYAANGVNFDGSNDYLTRGADLSGNADSKLFTMSFWFNRNGTGNNQSLYHSDIIENRVRFSSADELEVQMQDPSDSVILEINSTTAITDTASWHHLAFSVDMADTGKRHLFVDGSSDLTVVTYDNALIDFTRPDHAIGAKTNGTARFNGCFADVWIGFGQYIDLSVAANLQKFRSSDGNPVNLGSDGSTPTGTAPIMFFSGDTTGWETNLGPGGGFTENGTLTDCGTDP